MLEKDSVFTSELVSLRIALTGQFLLVPNKGYLLSFEACV